MLLRQCSNKALSSTNVAQEPLGNLLRNLKHAAIFGLPLALLKALALRTLMERHGRHLVLRRLTKGETSLAARRFPSAKSIVCRIPCSSAENPCHVSQCLPLPS